MKQPVNSPCFLCGALQSELLLKAKYPEHGYAGIFAVRKCVDCGLLFNSPRIPDNAFVQLYNRNYYFFKRTAKAEFQRIVSMYQRTVALIENKVPLRRVLEIGSAKGYLLAVLKQKGWDVQGVEISEQASRFAQKHFGVNVFTGSIEDYAKSNSNQQFPLVMAIDLLEHVLDPLQFLGCVSRLVENSGLLVIDTPNADAYNRSVLGPQWIGYNPFHIYLFSSVNLKTLLSRYGFTIEKVFSYENEKVEKTSIPWYKKAAITKSGPYNLAKRTWKMLSYVTNIVPPKRHLDNVMKTIDRIPDYFGTDDSRKILAETCRGDNIVVIARKVA